MNVSTPTGMQIGSAVLTGFTYGVFAPWFQSSLPPYGPASIVTGPYIPPSVSGIGIMVRLAHAESILLAVTEQFGWIWAMHASNESAWLAPPLGAGVLLELEHAVSPRPSVMTAMPLNLFIRASTKKALARRGPS